MCSCFTDLHPFHCFGQISCKASLTLFKFILILALLSQHLDL